MSKNESDEIIVDDNIREELNFSWLEEQALYVKEESRSLADAAQKLEELIIKHLVQMLKVKQWTLVEFLTLCIGFYLSEKIQEEKYIKENPSYPRSLTRPLDRTPLGEIRLTWIKMAILAAKKLYDGQFKRISRLIQSGKIKEVSPSIEWLILADEARFYYPLRLGVQKKNDPVKNEKYN